MKTQHCPPCLIENELFVYQWNNINQQQFTSTIYLHSLSYVIGKWNINLKN